MENAGGNGAPCTFPNDKQMNNRSHRQRYREIEHVKELVTWIEEAFKPRIMVHLTFAKPTGKAQADKAYRRFMNRMSRNRTVKQHLHFFGYGDYQNERRDKLFQPSYHYHTAVAPVKEMGPTQVEEVIEAMDEVWMKCGGGKKSLMVEYKNGGGALHYAALYHKDEWDYVSCNSRKPCRKVGCIYLDTIKKK